MSASDITKADFKAFFTRGFPYLPDGDTAPTDEYVTDGDLSRANSEALVTINEGLFGDAETLRIAFLYLWAHFLCIDLQMGAQGPSSVGYHAVSSRGVGSVSESYAVPDWAQNDPILAGFAQTRFGQSYLGIVRPLIVGSVQTFGGWTTP